MMAGSDFGNRVRAMLGKVRQKAPLVHCITNFVTVNDCANIILAAGGSPTMSRHPEEVCEITAGCSALVLNMGTVSDPEAMQLAGRRANELAHPVILDPVGVGASALRRSFFAKLTTEVHPDVIRGNASEIRYIGTGSGDQAGGIDAALEDRITEGNLSSWAAMAHGLSERMGSVICISGATDLIAGEGRVFAFPGGCALMSRITGSGCMLTALMGAFLGAAPTDRLAACVCAQSVMNAAGEIALAKTEAAGGGTMTFRMHLIDAVSLMTEELWDEYARITELPVRDL